MYLFFGRTYKKVKQQQRQQQNLTIINSNFSFPFIKAERKSVE